MQRQRSSMKRVRVQDGKEADVKSDSSTSHIGGVFLRGQSSCYMFTKGAFTITVRTYRLKG